jgi:hypothetical protein
MLINKANVRKACRPYRVSRDFYQSLDIRVAELLEDAKKRARNKKTLLPIDLLSVKELTKKGLK